MRASLPLTLVLAVAATTADAAPWARGAPEARSRAHERFAARHPWKGRTTNEVVRSLRADGFHCALEFRSEVREFRERPRALRDGKVAVLYCSKWDPTPGLECLEERASFDIDLPDVEGDAEALRERVEAAPIVGVSFVCVPAKGGVGR